MDEPLQQAETCLKSAVRSLCEGDEPEHYWLVGGSIRDVKPSLMTKCIYIENGTLDMVVTEVKIQLEQHSETHKSDDGKVEPVFIFFAVGLFDLVTDETPISLISNLTQLVTRERALRDEFSFYGNAVSNICFCTAYPPSMEVLGAGFFAPHAQQFVDMAMRWYNRWTNIVNSHNGSGLCRMDKPFHYSGGKYKLKISQLLKDGVMPNDNTAKAFDKLIDKSLQKLKDMWEKKENFVYDKPDLDVVREGWLAVKKAEKIYLDAFSGTCRTFTPVFMPFVTKVVSGKDEETNNVTSNDGIAGKHELLKRKLQEVDGAEEVNINSHSKKQDETVDGAETGNDTAVTNTTDEAMESSKDQKLSESINTEIKMDAVKSPNENKLDEKVKKVVYNWPDAQTCDSVVTQADESELRLYHFAQGMVAHCSLHIQSRALRLLEEFKDRERKLIQSRTDEDRSRVANFKKRMKQIEQEYTPESVEFEAKHPNDSSTAESGNECQQISDAQSSISSNAVYKNPNHQHTPNSKPGQTTPVYPMQLDSTYQQTPPLNLQLNASYQSQVQTYMPQSDSSCQSPPDQYQQHPTTGFVSQEMQWQTSADHLAQPAFTLQSEQGTFITSPVYQQQQSQQQQNQQQQNQQQQNQQQQNQQQQNQQQQNQQQQNQQQQNQQQQNQQQPNQQQPNQLQPNQQQPNQQQQNQQQQNQQQPNQQQQNQQQPQIWNQEYNQSGYQNFTQPSPALPSHDPYSMASQPCQSAVPVVAAMISGVGSTSYITNPNAACWD